MGSFDSYFIASQHNQVAVDEFRVTRGLNQRNNQGQAAARPDTDIEAGTRQFLL